MTKTWSRGIYNNKQSISSNINNECSNNVAAITVRPTEKRENSGN